MTATDPKALRALAHPVRLDLLELLAARGPATAAQCGRVLGIPQANCSFHLRQLAKYDFVEEAAGGEDKRERRWRIAESFGVSTDEQTPGVLLRELGSLVARRETERIVDYLTNRVASESTEWRAATGGVSAVVQLTIDEAAAIQTAWRELMAPYIQRALDSGFEPRADMRSISYFMAATPMPYAPTDTEQGD